jgi:hypothetical protein
MINMSDSDSQFHSSAAPGLGRLPRVFYFGNLLPLEAGAVVVPIC